MLKKVLQFNAADFGVIAAAGCGLFLVIQIIINTVMLTVKPDTVPTLCSILVPIILGFILLIFFINNLLVNFDFLLRCSVTRKQALGSVMVLLVLESAAAIAVSLALGRADRLIARAWAAARPELTVEEFFSPPVWGLALGYAAVLLLGLITAAFCQRFGRRALWVLWGFWMAFAFGINLVDWDALGDRLSIFSSSLPVVAVPIALVVLAAAAWSVREMLRATVKS